VAGEGLGSAVLELTTNNAPLEAGIDSAGRTAETFVDKWAKFDFAKDLFNFAREGLAKFQAVVGDWIDSAAESELAGKRLEAALTASGQGGAGAADDLKRFASELQSITRHSDEAIMESERLFISFGATRDNVQRLTRAAMDLAAGLGIDLGSATMMLAKATDGNTAALGRYGIKVDETATDAQKLEQALGLIEQRFGGLAEEEGKTFIGIWDRVRNAWDEVKEAMGRIIINSPVLRSMLQSVQTQFEGLSVWIDANSGAITRWIDGSLTQAVGYLQQFVGWLEELARQHGLTSLADGLGVLSAALATTLNDTQSSVGQVITLIKTVNDTWVYVSQGVSGSPLVPTANTDAIDTTLGTWGDRFIAFMGDAGWQAGTIMVQKLGERISEWSDRQGPAIIGRFVDNTIREFKQIAGMIFYGPTYRPMAEGSPKLPLTDYFGGYAPGLLGGFAAQANDTILNLRTGLTDVVNEARSAMGGGMVTQPNTVQHADIYAAYKAGAPGAGYAFTSYGQGGGQQAQQISTLSAAQMMNRATSSLDRAVQVWAAPGTPSTLSARISDSQALATGQRW
jgi:hypothetical protein